MTSSEVFARAREQGIKTIRLVVHQPKVGGTREWSCSLADLEEFAIRAKSGARKCEAAGQDYGILSEEKWQAIYLNPAPNEEECAFCKAMSVCPAAQAQVNVALDTPSIDAFAVVAEADGVQTLVPTDPAGISAKLAAAGFVEDWAAAVRAEAERQLLAGQPVPGFGLELGRQGPRKWADPVAAEATLRKQFRLSIEQAHNLKLKSPTQIEELSKVPKGSTEKPAIGPRQWKTLQDQIVRSDPKPSVKPLAVIKKPYQPLPSAGSEAFPEAPTVDTDDLV